MFPGRDARACQGDSGAWAGGRGLKVTSGARARQPVVVEDGVGGVGGSVHKTVVAIYFISTCWRKDRTLAQPGVFM